MYGVFIIETAIFFILCGTFSTPLKLKRFSSIKTGYAK
ncbi:putative membrane protein [Morganella morganii]|nr:putative membrane protein [Morganella morganii]